MSPNDLIQRFLLGKTSDAETAELDRLLAGSPLLRRKLLEEAHIETHLRQIAQERSALPRATTSGRPFFYRWQPIAAAAACVALLLGGGFWWNARRAPLAVVVGDAGAVELSHGSKLGNRTYSLKAGNLELLTRLGARLVIEAPAEFQFESAQRLRLLSGRLSAEVPPAAKGFTVLTASGEVVDLGTRFGIDVPRTGTSEIHVFEGEVTARATGIAGAQSLRTGDALAMNGNTSAARNFRSAAFIQPDEIGSLSAGLAAGQRARSDAALTALRKDPSLIAFLDFETEAPSSGVFHTVQGRWPGSKAPEFVNISDHLKLNVGGEQEWPQLTLAAWVRLDRIDSLYQSLLHTDGWEESNPGQVHWMVTRHATMRLALRANTLAPGSEEKEHFPDSRTPVLPEMGRWMHLAVVYDSVAKTARFYLNGRFDKETRQAVAHPARLGPAQIGNWNRQDRKLSGRVDELLLLGRAMDDGEIRELFEAGNPYR